MCEFCLKHGEGEKWYLQAKNYSDDLLSDVRRRKFIRNFASKSPDEIARHAHDMDKLAKLPPLVRRMVTRGITRRMKRDHFGQVLPIEDVERIFGFVKSVVRVACMCRHATLGKEKRYCYGISIAPDGGKFGEILNGLDSSYLSGPDLAGREQLTPEEALAAFRDHEREGLCHTVWTFRSPFIGGLCNCDRTDCLAMRATVTHALPVMFRAEYVAAIDPDSCTGCRQCMRVCQFGAIAYSASDQKAKIDQKWCYGCGICRAACKKNAIRLEDRKQVPAAANLW